jgi:hypothetical protein
MAAAMVAAATTTTDEVRPGTIAGSSTVTLMSGW